VTAAGRPLAVVTGGSRGLGRAVCRLFASEGYAVAACARAAKDLRALKDEIQKSGGEIFVASADVGVEKDVRRFAKAVEGRFGRVDVLINNAGVLGPQRPLKDCPSAAWGAAVRTNILGLFHVTKAFLPLFWRQGSGCIINVSSGAGKTGKARWGAYCVSKFAMEGFTQVLAKETAERNIAVYSLNPGPTRTAMRAEAYPEEDPLTLPPPEKIAAAFLALARRNDVRRSGQYFEAREILAGDL